MGAVVSIAGTGRRLYSSSGGSSPYNGLTPDFYIAADGSGNLSTGGTTPETAWPLSALNSATARTRYVGNVIGMLDGTYNLIDLYGQHTSADFSTGEFGVDGGTGVGNETILVAQTRANSSSPTSGVVIDWQRSSMSNTNEGATLQPIGSYVIVDGIHFKSNNYRSIINYSGGGDYFTVRNCLFTDQSFTECTGSGKNSCTIYTQGHDFVSIENCRFEGGSAPGDPWDSVVGRHSVIQCYTITNNLTVDRCTFIGNGDDTVGLTTTGNFVFCKQGNARNLVVKNCYFQCEATVGQIIQVDGDGDVASVSEIYDNVFYRVPGSTSGGRHINVESGVSNIGTWNIHNNTFYGTTNSGGLYRFGVGPPAAFSMYNNLWSRASAGDSRGDVDIPALANLATVDYNMYDSSPVFVFKYNNNANSSSGLSAWQTASSKEANSLEVSDPLFVASGSGAAYFTLQSGSDGYNAGSDGDDIGARLRTRNVGGTI